MYFLIMFTIMTGVKNSCTCFKIAAGGVCRTSPPVLLQDPGECKKIKTGLDIPGVLCYYEYRDVINL